jgi:hypothetical protein
MSKVAKTPILLETLWKPWQNTSMSNRYAKTHQCTKCLRMFSAQGIKTHSLTCHGLTSGSAVSYVVNHGREPIAPPATSSSTSSTTATEAKLTEAEVKTELEGAAAAAEAPAAAAAAPPDPAAVMALADLAIAAIGQLAPSGVELPEHLVKLTPQERAILTPFAIKAAPKFAEMTAGLDQHAHLVFFGLVGWFGFVRWQAVKKLEKLIEARSVVTSSPDREPENPKDSEAAHPSKIFGNRMPGSPF